MSESLHVVVLSGSLPFPNGRATTSRVRLLSLALVERGHRVTVLSTRVSEVPPLVENRAHAGEWRGVRFFYTTGTTTRHPNFIVRRLIEFKGSLVAAAWLCRRSITRDIDCVFLWAGVLRWTVWGATLPLLLRLLRIPWVTELNELPWTLKSHPNVIERRTSPLSGALGAVCISAFLERWAYDWSRSSRRTLEVRRVPIVVDVDELSDVGYRPAESAQVLMAASAGFFSDLQLVLESMETVWQTEPTCRLVITGWIEGDHLAHQAFSQVCNVSRPQNVALTGYMPRSQLLAAYGTSAALLAPLAPGSRSEARFPTKIGEYLASGRPVIITGVGEPGRLLRDGLNAYVADTPDPVGYGNAILRAIRSSDAGSTVGHNGRKLAMEEFHYSKWGESLESLFMICSAKKGPRRS